jgi:ADP-heptose:LPS heptosyltransferase
MGRRILVIQPAFLGDAVLATSLVETLRAAEPDAVISLLVRKEAASLFDGHPFLDRVWAWDRGGGALRKYGRLLKLARAVRAARYDAVLNIHRHGSSAWIALRSGAETVGFSSAPIGRLFTHRVEHAWGDGTHEIERNAALLRALGVRLDQVNGPKLYPPEMGERTAGAIVLAPGSVWATKRWPAEKWVELAGKLKGERPGTEILWMGGPADRLMLEKAAREAGAGRVVAGEFSLLESAGVMARAALVISGDSAPLHLASAVDAPTLGVFCSTTEAFGFGPTSVRSAVVEVLPNQLACKPCGMHGRAACPLRHFKCGQDLGSEKVFEAAQQLLAS